MSARHHHNVFAVVSNSTAIDIKALKHMLVMTFVVVGSWMNFTIKISDGDL